VSGDTAVADVAGDEAGFAGLGRHAALIVTAISALERIKSKGRYILAEYSRLVRRTNVFPNEQTGFVVHN
jgi:hypothetical protein